MNNAQIKRILSGIKLKTDERIQTPGVRALILSTNQGINHREEFLTFDTTNQFIRIKKFTNEVVSGRLSNSVSINGSELTVNNSIYLRHSLHPFRAPKVGDIIFIVNQDGSYKETGLTIVGTATNYLKLSGSLTGFNKETQQLCYAHGEKFKSAVQDLETPALFFAYTQISENKDDVILNLSELIGIETNYPMLGSV